MLQPARKMLQEMLGQGIPTVVTLRWDMGLRAGRKVLWDALVWQRRPGNRKRKVHKSQARISFIFNPSASALMMLQVKNKAAHTAPVPVEGSQNRDLTTVPSAWHAQGMGLSHGETH